MANKKHTYHRDGTVTYWSVYEQRWHDRANRISDKELAAMSGEQRTKTLSHLDQNKEERS